MGYPRTAIREIQGRIRMVRPSACHRKEAAEIYDVKTSLQLINMETGMATIGKRSGSLFKAVAAVRLRLPKAPATAALKRLSVWHLSVIFC
jgi:hypothetical protein